MQSEKLCPSLYLIHAAFQSNGLSIRLFCYEACSSTAWFIKNSHVRRSCCCPADKSQVLLMLHFLCCHSGLFWWLLLWVGWVGEKVTWEKDGERICSQREWRIWIWPQTQSLCNCHQQQEFPAQSKPVVLISLPALTVSQETSTELFEHIRHLWWFHKRKPCKFFMFDAALTYCGARTVLF